MLKMIIVSLCFKSISFPAGNIAIIRALRVESTALYDMSINLFDLIGNMVNSLILLELREFCMCKRSKTNIITKVDVQVLNTVCQNNN